MDFAAWKNVLLEWATCTTFLDGIHHSLNRKNVQIFFNNFKSHLTTVEIHEDNVVDFLKSHYPDIEINTTDTNEIIEDDLIYIYSLFLHFSCVRYPERDIQDACQRLGQNTQCLIAAFFKSLLEKGSFDKDALQAAISVAVEPPEPYDRLSNSPIKIDQRYAPPTPKSKMLDEWNSENKKLRALIETERFEKGYIEIQLRQMEEKYKKISKEHQKCVDEMHVLTNKLLCLETENISPNKNANDDQVKRRLRKAICNKDEAIIQLQSELHIFKDKNDKLTKILNTNEKHSMTLDSQINELNYALDHARREAQDKDQLINELQMIKQELEMFIDSGRNNFDISVECVDTSTIGDHNRSEISFSLNSSPENLAHSVIDIQLREQQSQNRKLLDEIEYLKEKFKIKIEKLTITLNETQNLLQTTVTFADNELKKLAKNCNDLSEKLIRTENEMTTVEAKVQSFQVRNEEMIHEAIKSERITDDLNQKIDSLTNECENLKSTLMKKQQEEIIIQETIQTLTSENENYRKNNLSLKCSYDSLNNELQSEQEMATMLMKQVNELKTIETDLIEKCTNYEKLCLENKNLEENYELLLNTKNKLELELHIQQEILHRTTEDYSALKIEMKTLQELNTNLLKDREEINLNHRLVEEMMTLKLESLEEDNMQLNNNLQRSTEELTTLKNEIQSLSLANQELKNDFLLLKNENNRTNLDLSNLTEQLKITEEEKTKLLKQIDLTEKDCQNNKNLAEKLKQKSDELQNGMSINIQRINKLEHELKEINKEKEKADKLQSKHYSELCAKDHDYSQLISELKEKLRSQQENAKLRDTELNEEKNRLKETIDQYEITEKEMKQNRNELEKKLDEMQIQLENSCKEIEHITAKLSEAQNLLQSTVSNADFEIHKLTNAYEQATKNLALSDQEKQSIYNEVEFVKCEIIKMEKELVQSKQDVTELNQHIVCQTKEYDHLNFCLNEKVNREKSFEETIEKLKTDNDNVQREMLFVKCENDKLNTELTLESEKLKLLNHEIENLNCLLNEKSHSFDELQLEKENYKKQMRNIAEEKVKLIIQVQHLNEMVKDVSNELIELKVENVQLQQHSLSLEKDIDRLQEERSQLENEIKICGDNNEQLKQQMDCAVQDLTNKYTKLVDDLTVQLNNTQNLFQSTVTYADNEIEKLIKDYDKVKSQLKELEIEKQMINDEFELSKKEIKQLENESNKGIEHLNYKISTLTIECEELKLNLAERNEIECNNRDKIDKLNADHENLQKTIQSIKSDKEELNAELKGLENKLQENTQNNEELHSQKESFKQQLETLLKDKKELDGQVDILSQRLNEVSQQLSHVKLENVKLSEDNSKLVTEIEQLHVDHKTLDEKNLEKIKLLEDGHNNLKISLEEKANDLLVCKVDKKNVMEAYSQLQEEANSFKDENADIKDASSKVTVKLSLVEQENADMLKELERVRHECKNYQKIGEELKVKWEELQVEIVANQQRNTQLECQLKQVLDTNSDGTKQVEYDELCNKEKELSQAVAILQAKLMKHRENSTIREKEWLEEKEKLQAAITEQESAEERIKQNRNELEGKLEKMKTKMKTLYSEEITKVKNKYEQEIYEFKAKVHKQDIKIQEYEQHVEKLAKQMFQLNDSHLELKKQNEIMKTKIRFMEENPHASKRALTTAMAIGGNFKMEDEEPELFNNDYLEELKSGTGRLSPGRQSVRLSELKFRNSMLPFHLRSSYAAQYGDQGYAEDDLKIDGLCDESVLSNQSEVRRGTLYQKPGPPTPSKNGGRLSFGGSVGGATSGRLSIGTGGACDPTRDPLKETNNNSNSRTVSTSKRPTAGTFRSMFASTKVRDEKKSGHQIRKITLKSSATGRRQRTKHVSNVCQHNVNDSTTENTSSIEFDNETCICGENFPPSEQIENELKQCCPFSSDNMPQDLKDRRMSMFKANLQYAILNKRRLTINSSKIMKKVRKATRLRAKQDRQNTHNKLRPLLHQKSSIDSGDSDAKITDGLCGPFAVVKLPVDDHFHGGICNPTSKSNCADGNIFEDEDRNRCNDKNPFSSSTNEFEVLLDAKQCEMPFMLNDPAEPTMISTFRNRSNSKTMYSDPVIHNRKIPYLSIGSSISRPPSCMSLNQNDKITLNEIRSWNRLDTNIQACVVFFIICLAINLYYLIQNHRPL